MYWKKKLGGHLNFLKNLSKKSYKNKKYFSIKIIIKILFNLRKFVADKLLEFEVIN